MPKSAFAEWNMLPMREAKKYLDTDKSIVLLDVRETIERTKEYIKGSINIPLDSITKKVMEDILPDKYTKIFIYCKKGVDSKKACIELTEMGYQNVTDIGSIDCWRYGLETGEQTADER